MVGTAAPFASFGTHSRVSGLQNCVDSQSPSTVHEPAAWHRPLMEHTPERQVVAALNFVHGPLPLAKPHLASMSSHTLLRQTTVAFALRQGPVPFPNPHSLSVASHTALLHTAFATSSLHAPVSAGSCPERLGIGCAFGSLAVHRCATLSQNCVVAQSPSTVQEPTC